MVNLENLELSYNRQQQAKILEFENSFRSKKKIWLKEKLKHKERYELLVKPYLTIVYTKKAEIKNLRADFRALKKKNRNTLSNAIYEAKSQAQFDRSEIRTELKLRLLKIEINYKRARREYEEAVKDKLVLNAKEKLQDFDQQYNDYLVEFKKAFEIENKDKFDLIDQKLEAQKLILKEEFEYNKIRIIKENGPSAHREIKEIKREEIAKANIEINRLKLERKAGEDKDLEQVLLLKETYVSSKKVAVAKIKNIKDEKKAYFKTLSKEQQQAYLSEEKLVKQDHIAEVKNSIDRFEHHVFKRVNPAYIYVAPAIFSALFFTVLPFIFMLVASFFKVNLSALRRSEFRGFQNFATIFTLDREFQLALTNTLIYSLITVVLLGVVTIGVAAWLSKNTKVHNLAQTMIFTPHIASLVAISILWIALLHPTGLINQLLAVFGIEGPGWLIQKNTALLSISMVTVWKEIGYYALLIIAGLQAIPAYIYEAAKLDKATKSKAFFKLTIPLLAPTLSFVFVNKFISSFKVFAPIEIMTNGGPMGASMVLSYWIYKVGRIGYNYGFAMAGAIVLTLFIAFFTWINYKLFTRRITY